MFEKDGMEDRKKPDRYPPSTLHDEIYEMELDAQDEDDDGDDEEDDGT